MQPRVVLCLMLLLHLCFGILLLLPRGAVCFLRSPVDTVEDASDERDLGVYKQNCDDTHNTDFMFATSASKGEREEREIIRAAFNCRSRQPPLLLLCKREFLALAPPSTCVCLHRLHSLCVPPLSFHRRANFVLLGDLNLSR